MPESWSEKPHNKEYHKMFWGEATPSGWRQSHLRGRGRQQFFRCVFAEIENEKSELENDNQRQQIPQNGKVKQRQYDV